MPQHGLARNNRISEDSGDMGVITTLSALAIIQRDEELLSAALGEIEKTSAEERSERDPDGQVDKLLVAHHLLRVRTLQLPICPLQHQLTSKTFCRATQRRLSRSLSQLCTDSPSRPKPSWTWLDCCSTRTSGRKPEAYWAPKRNSKNRGWSSKNTARCGAGCLLEPPSNRAMKAKHKGWQVKPCICSPTGCSAKNCGR